MGLYTIRKINNKEIKYIYGNGLNVVEKKEVEEMIEKKSMQIGGLASLCPGDLVSRFGKNGKNTRSFEMNKDCYLKYIGFIKYPSTKKKNEDNYLLLFEDNYPDHYISFEFIGSDVLIITMYLEDNAHIIDIRNLDYSLIIKTSKVLENLKNGATIFGDLIANDIKAISKIYPEAIKFAEIEVLIAIDCDIYQNSKLAHFGAILTDEGRELLLEFSGSKSS